IEHFDGYRIGLVKHIFNPYTLLAFITQLSSVKALADVDYSKYSFWVDTGSMRVLEAITASSAQDLRKYCEYLSSSFLRQSEYRRHLGPLAELMSSDNIDDDVVRQIGSQDYPWFPVAINPDMCAELAAICMFYPGDAFPDLWNMGRAPLHVRTIVRLLYQAGYIVPTGKDSVGIPNAE
ncbi:hypothetical protein EV175_007295, partial [Coemansia sp. RSA 1933]